MIARCRGGVAKVIPRFAVVSPELALVPLLIVALVELEVPDTSSLAGAQRYALLTRVRPQHSYI